MCDKFYLTGFNVPSNVASAIYIICSYCPNFNKGHILNQLGEMFSSLLALNAKQSDGQDPKYRVDMGKEDSTPHLVRVKSSLLGPKQSCVQKEYFGEH